VEIKKIKTTLLIFVALVVAGFSVHAIAQNNSSSNKNIFADSDQDGLSDQEELAYGTDPNLPDTDMDGYSDGIELKSGYDPLKPAPGDKIVSSSNKLETEGVGGEQEVAVNENLTQELSAGVASLISNANSGDGNVNLADIDELVQNTLNSKISFEDLPDVDESLIKIKKQNYSSLSDEKREEREKEDAVEYLTAVSYLAINNLPYSISSEKDIKTFANDFMSQVETFSTSLSNVSYFEELAGKAEGSMDQLQEIEVPENFLELHIKGLKILKYAVSLGDEVKPDSSDPIETIANLSKVEGLLTLVSDFTQEVESEFSELGIQALPINL
jgi:hypothetical protein